MGTTAQHLTIRFSHPLPASRSAVADLYRYASLEERPRQKRITHMKVDKSKYDSNGQLKNGIFREHFKDGTLSCVGA